MKFGLFYEHQVPRPWNPESERRVLFEALERGDRVVATARDERTLDGLTTAYGENVLTLALDVTDKAGAEAAIRKAADHFGRCGYFPRGARPIRRDTHSPHSG